MIIVGYQQYFDNVNVHRIQVLVKSRHSLHISLVPQGTGIGTFGLCNGRLPIQAYEGFKMVAALQNLVGFFFFSFSSKFWVDNFGRLSLIDLILVTNF